MPRIPYFGPFSLYVQIASRRIGDLEQDVDIIMLVMLALNKKNTFGFIKNKTTIIYFQIKQRM